MKRILLFMLVFVLLIPTACVSKQQSGVAPNASVLAAVRSENEKYGFIDKVGEWVVQPVFEKVGNFFEGLAAVKKDGKWGYIDNTGAFVIEPRFDYAMRFSDGMAPVYICAGEEVEEWFIDRQGSLKFRIDLLEDEWYTDYHDGLLRVCKGGKFGFIDKTGKTVIEFLYDYADDFSNGRAMVLQEDDKSRKYGVIKPNGEFLIPLIYDYITPFAEGVAVAISSGEPYDYYQENSKSYIFDEQGKLINSVRGNLDQFKRGLASFSEKVILAKPPEESPSFRSMGLTDISGNKLFDPQKCYCYFIGDAIRVEDIVIDYEKGDYNFENARYVDATGKLLFRNTDLYDKAPFSFNKEFDRVYVDIINNGIAIVAFADNLTEDPAAKYNEVKWESYCAAITTDGQLLTVTRAMDRPLYYRDGTLTGWNEEEDCFVFVDKAGIAIKRKLENTTLEYHFSLWAVCEEGKWGYLNTSGQYAIAPRFLWAGAFHSVE